MNLGQRIKEKRQALGITQGELADNLVTTPQHISAIEQDKRTPSLQLFVKLAEELGTTFDYLLTGKEGIMPDIIVAIKADGSLNLDLKKALITMVKSLRGSNVSDRIDHNANH